MIGDVRWRAVPDILVNIERGTRRVIVREVETRHYISILLPDASLAPLNAKGHYSIRL